MQSGDTVVTNRGRNYACVAEKLVIGKESQKEKEARLWLQGTADYNSVVAPTLILIPSNRIRWRRMLPQQRLRMLRTPPAAAAAVAAVVLLQWANSSMYAFSRARPQPIRPTRQTQIPRKTAGRLHHSRHLAMLILLVDRVHVCVRVRVRVACCRCDC